MKPIQANNYRTAWGKNLKLPSFPRKMILILALSDKQADKMLRGLRSPSHWRPVHQAQTIPSTLQCFLLFLGNLGVKCPQHLPGLRLGKLESTTNDWVSGKGDRGSWTQDACHYLVGQGLISSSDWDDTIWGYCVVASRPAKFIYLWPGKKERKRMGNAWSY